MSTYYKTHELTMFPMNRKALRELPVTVEYDSRGKRVTKTLPNSFAARSFFTRMDKAGKRPRIVQPA